MPAPARSAESLQEAQHFLVTYLKENVAASSTLEAMKENIAEFKRLAPRVIITKCIDGRVHGSKGIGYPPTTVTFSRTEGNKLDTSLRNIGFYQRTNGVVVDARNNTSGTPALFMALAHTAKLGHGCAALGGDNEMAIKLVSEQAQEVRAKYKPEDLYVLYGMTNTDDMSKRLYFPNGTTLDSAEIIDALHLQHPTDVFQSDFLQQPIDDIATARDTQNLLPKHLLEGTNAPLYRDLRTAISMETYLLREISKIERRHGANNHIFNEQVLQTIGEKLGNVSDLPDSLRAPLLYQTVWNIAYTLYQRNWLSTMNAEERALHLEHAETLVCYGDGFEVLSRNRAILVKTGRGDDTDALKVAKKVLEHNREVKKQNHPPIVHINVEVADVPTSWNSLNDQVLAKIATMELAIGEVFGDDVYLLTTYSLKELKRFYPIDLHLDADVSQDPYHFPTNIIGRMLPSATNDVELLVRQRKYTQEMTLGS